MTRRLSIGTGVSVFVVLAGLALGLSDTLRNETVARVILVLGLLFLLVCLVVGAWSKFAPVIAARQQAKIDAAVERVLRKELVHVRVWVHEDVGRAIAEQTEEGRAAIAERANAMPPNSTHPTAEAELRFALNELSEELELILDRIGEDQPGYWRRFQLPTERWIAHRALLAVTDDDGHAALRVAYREADRINHCLHNQAQRYDDEGNPLHGKSVEGCEPGRYETACHNAKVAIRRMLRELAAGRR